MKRVTDVKETVDQAIRWVRSYPCCICSYENPRTHECLAGVKYKGTFPVYRQLKIELFELRTSEER